MDFKLELVAVPVSDVDRAKAFYTDKVGFKALPACSPDGPQTTMWSWGLAVPERL